MKTVTILKRARAKIVKGWCQGHSAIDSRGNLCLAETSAAVSWCAVGAIFAVSKNDWKYEEAARDVLEKALGKGQSEIANWNDEPKRTKKQVLALYDKAIRHLEKA